jgi:tripartite-type tricarboxylate transporter receptor subunit TctC
VGSIAHLTTELFDDAAGIRMTHVPYKGAANAAVDLAAGRIQVMISNYSTVAPLIKAGKIKALAVTSRSPQPAFPDLPPMASTAPNFGVDIWVGVFAPAGYTAVDRRSAESGNQRDRGIAGVSRGARADGTVAEAIPPAAFAAHIKDELAQWKKIATEHKIVAE